MEFKSLKNIETSFRQIRLYFIIFLVLCSVVVVWSVYSSYDFAEKQREKIYVLDGGKVRIVVVGTLVRQQQGTLHIMLDGTLVR